jgi:hypothetical protein
MMGLAGGSTPDRSPLDGPSDRLWHPHAAPCAAVLECQPEPSAERTLMSTRAKVVQPRQFGCPVGTLGKWAVPRRLWRALATGARDPSDYVLAIAVQPPMAPTVATVRFHVVGFPVLVASRMT